MNIANLTVIFQTTASLRPSQYGNAVVNDEDDLYDDEDYDEDEYGNDTGMCFNFVHFVSLGEKFVFYSIHTTKMRIYVFMLIRGISGNYLQGKSLHIYLIALGLFCKNASSFTGYIQKAILYTDVLLVNL